MKNTCIGLACAFACVAAEGVRSQDVSDEVREQLTHISVGNPTADHLEDQIREMIEGVVSTSHDLEVIQEFLRVHLGEEKKLQILTGNNVFHVQINPRDELEIWRADMPDKRDQGLVYDRYVLRWKKRSDDDFLPELILSKTHEDDEELERLDPKRTIWMKNPLTGEDDTPQPPRSIGERLTFSGHMEALLQYFVSDN